MTSRLEIIQRRKRALEGVGENIPLETPSLNTLTSFSSYSCSPTAVIVSRTTFRVWKSFFRHPVSCNLMTSSCAWLWVMMDAGGLMHGRMLSRHLQYPGHHHRVIQVSDYDTNDVWSIVTIVTDISLWHWTSAGMRGQDVHVRRILSWVRCRLMADISHQSWEKMRGLSCNI